MIVRLLQVSDEQREQEQKIVFHQHILKRLMCGHCTVVLHVYSPRPDVNNKYIIKAYQNIKKHLNVSVLQYVKPLTGEYTFVMI